MSTETTPERDRPAGSPETKARKVPAPPKRSPGAAGGPTEWSGRQYRTLALILAISMVLMVGSGISAFFLVLRGRERVLVPELRGLDLPDALVKMQERELYPRLSLRFTDDPAERNTILDQDPPAGSIVKAGRRIQITVSRGAVIDTVENYVGRDMDEVKLGLQTLFASSRPLVTVREPPEYRHDRSAPGTVLEQRPPAGAGISSPVALELVVSLGPRKSPQPIPSFLGLPIAEAMRLAADRELVLDCSMRTAAANEKPGTVAGQDPGANAKLESTGRIKLTFTAPERTSGRVSGIFVHELPEYPYAVPVSLDAISPGGEKIAVASMRHPGGSFSAPFFLPAGSRLVLSVRDREVARAEAR